MFVANRMTKNPVTVTPDTSLDDAARLMKKGHFRRLAVVDENGKLVGFFSDKDLMRAAPSPATTLSRYEATELLSGLKVTEIMQRDVVSVSDDATIEEAALIMYEKKIGGLLNACYHKLGLKDTVMFADHNCYYHDTTNHIKGIDKTEYSNIKLYNIPFMIYSKNLTPEQNYNYCNTYDIYPTICDLLGLKTNGSFVQGYSVFSEDIKNSVFISFLNGIYSDKFYTTNVVDCIKLKDGLTDADLLEFQLNVINFYLKQEQIEKIYKMNYFSL